ncbi:holin [Burkholderia phage Bm1]
MTILDRVMSDAEYIVVAAIGGVIGFAMRGTEKKTFKSYVFAAFSAAFVGYVVLKFCRSVGLSEDMIGAVAGLSGWVGAENAMAAIQKFAGQKLGMVVDNLPVQSPAEGEQHAADK